MRKIHSLGLVGAVALVLAAVVAPAANGATTRVETDKFSGVASARALELDLLGRALTFGVASTDSAADIVGQTLNMKASGIGTLLSPKTAITAVQGGDAPQPGGRSCFQPPLGDVLSAGLLPSLVVAEVACGQASVTGDLNTFTAEGIGEVANLRLSATQVLKPALDLLKPVLDTVKGTAVGELLKSADPVAQQAVGTLNGLFGSLLGQGSVVLPTIVPSQTVQGLVDGLANGDLLRVDIGDSIARNIANPTQFRTESIAKAGSIELLPMFRGMGLPPLLKITMGESSAAVSYDRGNTSGVGEVVNTLVRIESELLPQLALGQIGVAGIKPLETLVSTLGLKSGPGYIELAPGQSISIFCDNALTAALCSEISVGMPKETKMPDGSLKVESSSITVHLLKGLSNLVPGLGTILGTTDLSAVLAPVTGLAGLSLGEPTDVPGIRLALAQTVSQAGGSKVMGEVEERQRAAEPAVAPEIQRALPRTGGLPLGAATIPALLGASAGLRMFVRRRSNV
jgi:hypothetical protein